MPRKKEDYGPMFLTKDYPAGFQPPSFLRGIESTRESLNAAAQEVLRVQQVVFKLASEAMRSAQEAPSLESDKESCLLIVRQINSLMVRIKILKADLDGKTLSQMNDEMERLTLDVNDVITAATQGMDSLSISGKYSYMAARALTDVLQITRKSLPPGVLGRKGPYDDQKTAINNTRDGLVEKIREYERDLSTGEKQLIDTEIRSNLNARPC